MKNEIVFKESDYYKKNIKFFSNNLKKILKQNKINFKNATILDFGCGNCLLHKYLKFKKIFLYDLEHSYYNNNYLKKTKTFKTVKEIKNFKGKFDIILLNSVIQYIKPDDIKKILIILSKKINKHGLIILSDIPEKSRLNEILSFKELFNSLRVLIYFATKPRYLKYSFFYYQKDYLKKLLSRRNLDFSVKENLNFSKSRYTLIVKKN